jgi:phage baseplate assembly protein W
MADISHSFGEDIDFAPGGDLAVSNGSVLGQQRVLRRLLTNPGEYIWNADYGAGLARFLGQPIAEQRISAITRGQIFKEAAVARTPSPVIQTVSDRTGGVVLTLRYADAQQKGTVVMTVPVSGA